MIIAQLLDFEALPISASSHSPHELSVIPRVHFQPRELKHIRTWDPVEGVAKRQLQCSCQSCWRWHHGAAGWHQSTRSLPRGPNSEAVIPYDNPTQHNRGVTFGSGNTVGSPVPPKRVNRGARCPLRGSIEDGVFFSWGS